MGIYDGAVLKASRPMEWFGYRIHGIYLSAANAAAAGLLWANISTYNISIVGNPSYFSGTVPSTTYNIGTNWTNGTLAKTGGTTKTYLATYLINRLLNLETIITSPVVDLVTSGASGNYLTTTGEDFVNSAVPGANSILDIYSSSQSTVAYTQVPNTGAAQTLFTARLTGTYVETVRNGIATMMGISDEMAGMLLSLAFAFIVTVSMLATITTLVSSVNGMGFALSTAGVGSLILFSTFGLFSIAWIGVFLAILVLIGVMSIVRYLF
jgi:hypothetical protein